MNEAVWYGARCVFRFDGLSDGEPGTVYEERVTLHRAGSFDEAFEAAESAARTYEADDGPEFVGTTDVYLIDEELREGVEVFSLLRTVEVEPAEYIKRFVHTGHEVESLRTQTHRAVEPAAAGRRKA
jgi:hypothetical protein